MRIARQIHDWRGVFSFQGVGKVNRATAPGEVKVMPGFHLFEMEAQGFEQNVREHCHAVVFALAVPNNNLTIGEIQILHAQPEDLHETQTAAVHDLCHQLVDPVHFGDHFFRLFPGENRGNAFGFGWANRDESLFVQLDAENIAVQE